MNITELHDEENLLVQMQDRWENYGYNPPSTTARNMVTNGIKITYDETEETKNQVFGNILYLLVWPSGLSGGWSSEIPDIG